MKNKGFTLVELLAVLVLISLVMVIAIPGIFKMRDRMNEKALNANKYKSYFGECTTNGTHCECTNNKCKYKFVINIKDLIKSGDLKKETKDEETIEENVCSIYNPKDKTMCMDCLDINITLDATYKTVTASLDLNSANVCHEEYTTN